MRYAFDSPVTNNLDIVVVLARDLNSWPPLLEDFSSAPVADCTSRSVTNMDDLIEVSVVYSEFCDRSLPNH